MNQISMIITFMSCIFWVSQIQAQVNHGTIKYALVNPTMAKRMKEQVKDQPEEIQELILNRMKNTGQMDGVLYFDQDVSVYKSKPKDVVSTDQGGMVAQVKVSGGGVIYKELEEKKIKVKTQIIDKDFLIVDALPTIDWKIEKDTKQIGPFQAKKATATFNEREVEAWFTESIAISAGPGRYWGLPGLILEISEKDAWQYTFQGITVEAPPAEKLAAPSGGKEVSQAEFDKTQEKKMKELGGNGGGGVRIIRMGGDGN